MDSLWILNRYTRTIKINDQNMQINKNNNHNKNDKNFIKNTASVHS